MSGSTDRHIEIRIPTTIPEHTRIDSYLAEVLMLFSRSQVKRRVQEVRVNGGNAKVSRHLFPGDVLEITYGEEVMRQPEPEQIPLRILYEDRNVVVIDKESGMVVHPAAGNWSGTLVNALLGHCSNLRDDFPEDAGRPGIVHRLDKDTSGVIITAKNAQSREILAEQFRRRTVRKRYLALVEGRLPGERGRIDTWIARDPHNRKRFTCLLTGGSSRGKRALTFYRELSRLEDFTLVSLRPRTGRTHQLRVQMAHLGCPIVGDRLYGWKVRGGGERPLMLHAHRLRICLPGTQQSRTFEAPVPDRFGEYYNLSSR